LERVTCPTFGRAIDTKASSSAFHVAIANWGGATPTYPTVLVFSAAAKHLKHRDEWIGWSNE
jgi:hypothetical protein